MEQLVLYEGRPADCTGRLEKKSAPMIFWTSWASITGAPTMHG